MEVTYNPRLGAYAMILGCDILTGLGIKIDFGNNILEWDSIVITMKDAGENIKEALSLHEPKAVVQASDRLKSILDANYEKADLEEVAKEAVHLKESQQQQLHALLKEFPKLFDGALGKWRMEAYAILNYAQICNTLSCTSISYPKGIH
jgi:Zn-dependent M32 family carboxypeptidase